MGGCTCARGCERAGAGVLRRVHGCGRVVAGENVGIRMGVLVSGRAGSMGVLVSFFVETCIFDCFLAQTCLLFTVSTTRATTQFTLITAHHDQVHSQPYDYFSDFFGVSLRAGTRIPHGHRRRRGGVAMCAAR